MITGLATASRNTLSLVADLVVFCVFEKIRLPPEVRLSTAWSPAFVSDFALLGRALTFAPAIAGRWAPDDSVLRPLPRTVGALRLARRQPEAGARWVAHLLGLFVCWFADGEDSAGSMFVVLRLGDNAAFVADTQAHQHCWR